VMQARSLGLRGFNFPSDWKRSDGSPYRTHRRCGYCGLWFKRDGENDRGLKKCPNCGKLMKGA
jgi:hypothetical protein